MDLPVALSEPGLPVGVQTLSWDELSLEVWYPSPEGTTGESETIHREDWSPTHIGEVLGEVEVPGISSRATRDAPVRPTDNANEVEIAQPQLIHCHTKRVTRYDRFRSLNRAAVDA